MTDNPIRIDGWKAIASHFRRDRSTVLRWATVGDFPVRRGPGKKSASVYAYAHELDAWLAGRDPVEAPRSSAETVVADSRTQVKRRAAIAATAVLACGGVGAALVWNAGPAARAPAQTLPSDPATADLYLQARDDWSTRTPEGLKKATTGFSTVISRDPDFAPAYAGLADTYILAREFAAMPNAVALPKVEAAAKAALAIDPDRPDANRALGFVDYYGRHDIRAAQGHFGRSLRVAPEDAQTHFWFGNILVDVGDIEGGLRELRTARRLNPGSRAIQADYAVALWVVGPGDRGKSELEDLAAHGPPLASAHTYLSMIYLAKGEMAAYLYQREQMAVLQASPAVTARVAAERAAFERGGPSSVLGLIATAPPVADDEMTTATEWPATAAALTGRRERLLEMIARAESAKERWTTWRRDQPRFARWRGDRAVMAGLERVCSLPPGAG